MIKAKQLVLVAILILSVFLNGCNSQVEEELVQKQQEAQQQGQSSGEQGDQQKYKLEIGDEEVFLSKEEYNELMTFFKNYDTNGDGYVDREEFIVMGRSVDSSISFSSSSDQEISDLISMVDFNQDGLLSFPEFISLGFLYDDQETQGDDGLDGILNGDYEEEGQYSGNINDQQGQFIPDDL
ncbi:EF-hand protein (macronuclear) [Tetrahymena thermophila SB210]|uniref:EF-hand protein n=1 Tax=Tetrahymena thermophila (strain SB210) TaxID=312017 RepID=Q230Z2_TETTS|nr:EF-hand protein [Tetrahymena thermophila SB210]EAR91147.1 EF-hand protein [Tetrahymena thermophila SB210]|eukprot:XP_001011392.1 EF-hand protein [Tetrahymena thermophila SB210]